MPNRAGRLAILLTAVGLLVTGSAAAVAVGNGSSDHKVVPWLDRQMARPTAPLAVKSEPRPQAEACQRTHLDPLWPEGGATFTDTTDGSDSTGFKVLVRNVGPGPCTLSGHPTVQGLDRQGKTMGPAVEPGSYLPTSGQLPRLATIEPGESARFYLSVASRGCTGPRYTYRGAKVLLDNGMKMTLKNAWLSGVCPMKVSAWEPETDAAGPFWALEARIIAPSSADRGSELDYAVELVNVTKSTVTLRPCMIYTQILSPSELFDLEEIDSMYHSTYQLNCEPDTIGPRGTLKFAMKIAIPQGFPPGKTLLHGVAEGSPRPYTTTEFNVS